VTDQLCNLALALASMSQCGFQSSEFKDNKTVTATNHALILGRVFGKLLSCDHCITKILVIVAPLYLFMLRCGKAWGGVNV
jgi:hypothetical protein